MWLVCGGKGIVSLDNPKEPHKMATLDFSCQPCLYLHPSPPSPEKNYVNPLCGRNTLCHCIIQSTLMIIINYHFFSIYIIVMEGSSRRGWQLIQDYGCLGFNPKGSFLSWMATNELLRTFWHNRIIKHVNVPQVKRYALLCCHCEL